MKAATNEDLSAAFTTEFQSTPPVNAATEKFVEDENEDKISIHAAREGGDY